MRKAFFLENIRILLILKLESPIYGNIRKIFRDGFFFCFSSLGCEVLQIALKTTTIKPFCKISIYVYTTFAVFILIFDNVDDLFTNIYVSNHFLQTLSPHCVKNSFDVSNFEVNSHIMFFRFFQNLSNNEYCINCSSILS